jgi:hypothetical protein
MVDQFSRKDFLDALFHSYMRDHNGFIMVKTTSRVDQKTSTRYFPNTETLSREQYSEDYNVFLGLCPREKMKPGKDHIQYVTAVWAGLDIGPDGYSGKEKHFVSERQAFAALNGFPLKPSMLVRSGRGIHIYWLLRNSEPVADLGRVEGTLRRISDYFQCRSEVGIDAALRLPGTTNSKDPAQTRYCYADHINPKQRYNLEDFDDLDLRIVIPSKRPPKIPLPPPLPRSRVKVIRDAEEVEVTEEEQVVTITSMDTVVAEIEEDASADDRMILDKHSMNKLTESFIEAFSDQMLDKLADRIVEKLAKRFGGIGKRP